MIRKGDTVVVSVSDPVMFQKLIREPKHKEHLAEIIKQAVENTGNTGVLIIPDGIRISHILVNWENQDGISR